MRTILLSEMSAADLAAVDGRYPKWGTMCQLRRLELPVLNAVLVVPGQGRRELEDAVMVLAEATGNDRLLVRSDGGVETRRYYRGGNSFPLAQVASKAAGLLETGRAVILMESTNRFTNHLTALLRMDRPSLGQEGTFTIDGLGPGYDVADLTRGGISPQVTVSAAVDWSEYRELWWSDLRVSISLGDKEQDARRQRRLVRLATDVLADTGHLVRVSDLNPSQRAAAAEAWLRGRGHEQLWQEYDVTTAIARRVHRWFEDAFVIAACHPHRTWTCLATATSNLGGRWVFWDIVDGQYKYAGKRATSS